MLEDTYISYQYGDYKLTSDQYATLIHVCNSIGTTLGDKHAFFCNLCDQILREFSEFPCGHDFCNECLSKRRITLCPSCDSKDVHFIPSLSRNPEKAAHLTHLVQMVAEDRLYEIFAPILDTLSYWKKYEKCLPETTSKLEEGPYILARNEIVTSILREPKENWTIQIEHPLDQNSKKQISRLLHDNGLISYWKHHYGKDYLVVKLPYELYDSYPGYGDDPVWPKKLNARYLKKAFDQRIKKETRFCIDKIDQFIKENPRAQHLIFYKQSDLDDSTFKRLAEHFKKDGVTSYTYRSRQSILLDIRFEHKPMQNGPETMLLTMLPE